MRRSCTTLYLVASLWVLPFPNAIIAPGYGDLPRFEIPTVSQAVEEMPSIVGKIYYPLRYFYWHCQYEARTFSEAIRGVLFHIVVFGTDFKR